MNVISPNRLTRLIFRAIPNFILRRVVLYFKAFDFIKETEGTQTPITFYTWYNHKIQNFDNSTYWPCHPTSTISGASNIYCGIETSPGFSPGNYISAYHGKIYIGDYTQIAPNVGIISSNHDVYDNSKHIPNEVRIGKYCWLGMGAVIMPGVVLGDFTIVAAGAIVTKSFIEGYCVIGGNPAKEIKKLDKSKCIESKSEHEYNGYILHNQFENYRKNYLNV